MNDASPRLTERGRQRRRAMLDAATQAFLEHGFEGTTLDMVIERAGGSRGTLYSSFGGKEGLFAAVIAHMIEEIFDDSADQPRPAATLSATLEHFGRRFLTSLLDPRCQSLYRLVVAESPRFPAIGKSFYEQGPQQSYLLLSERLAAVAPHMDEETLYAVACQFLEMLKADLFLKALSVADFQPTMALLETRLKLSVDIIACYLEHLSQRPERRADQAEGGSAWPGSSVRWISVTRGSWRGRVRSSRGEKRASAPIRSHWVSRAAPSSESSFRTR